MIYAGLRRTDGMIKVGCSRNPMRRVSQQGLALIAIWEGSFREEKEAHQFLRPSCCNDFKRLGSYSAPLGPREWFRPTQRVQRFIKKMGYSRDEILSGRFKEVPEPLLTALGLQRVISYEPRKPTRKAGTK